MDKFDPVCIPYFISIKTIAQKLGVSRATIYRIMASDPKFPQAYRFAGTLKFKTNEINHYIEEKNLVQLSV